MASKKFDTTTYDSSTFDGSAAAPPALAISNVQSSGVTNSQVTITWDTNYAASSQVEYGLTVGYGSSTTLDAALVTSHTVIITGLSAATLYHFRVKSDDGSGLVVSGDFNFTTSSVPEPPLPLGILNLSSGGNDWTDRVTWSEFKFSFRKDVGVAATFPLDTTDVIGIAPGCDDEFLLTLPTGEIFVMVPVGDPSTPIYRQDAHDISLRDTVHSYELIDIVSALDRIPLPEQQFIESNAGEIISTLIAALNSDLDTSGIAVGNNVPYLDTNDFAKFSDIAKHASIQTGGYTVQIDPNTNGGYAVIADYNDNFGASGIVIDKDTVYEEGISVDFTPQKDLIEPDNNIINVQRVKSTKPGPHHTVCEFREFDALVPSFKLKALPYGLDGAELLNFQIDAGNISAGDQSSLPKIIPLHYPVQVEIADISLGGSGSVCGFIGRGGVTLLSLLVGGSGIGATVNGSAYTASAPFAVGAPAADINHQFYYDFHAFFGASGLTVTITENYLNNLAGETALATVTSVDMSTGVVGLSLIVGSTSDLPNSIRFFNPADPTDVRGFSTIRERSGGSITIDNIPTTLVVGDKLASGDSASVTVTDQIVYSGAAPSNRYGKPQLVISGGSGITARQWTASYGPPVEIQLLANTYTGASGRKLKVGTPSSKSADIAIAASGNTAVCTFVGDRLPLRGDIQLIINYDAAKIIDVTVEDVPSQSRCGIRQGEIIESDAVLTGAEATALGQSVLDEFADPKPKGTIKRESWLTTRFPLPNELVSIDVPSEYMITAADTPISEISIDFGGYDWATNDGILIYHISLGNIGAKESVDRQLLANQVAQGIQYRPLSAPGARISSASWNDIDTVSLGISGSIALNGIPAGGSFDPAQYATGNLREAPVSLAGTVTSGGVVGELLVEVIYPPLDVDADSETCHYSPRTNSITYRFGRPPGAKEYWIKRLLDDGTGTNTLVFKQVDKIFSESYPLPYEPASKKIQVLTIGLADKKGAGGYIELDCDLTPLPAPTTFDIVPNKAVKPSGRIPFLVSAPPTGEFLHRVEFLRILLTKTPSITPPTTRAHFPDTDVNLYRANEPMQGVTTSTHQVEWYEEFEPGESVWATAMWVDKFGEEGAITVPFDVLHPPVTAGSISLVDFFQSATQANGGAVEDDNEVTPQTEYSGVFRIHLGNHNSAVKLWMQESAAIVNGGAYDTTSFTSHSIDVTDSDVINGYIDVPIKQKFRQTKKKVRNYRPDSVTFIGSNIRTRDDGSGDSQNTHEKRFLVGYIGSPPTLVEHEIDAVFDKSTFEFRPGINGLANNFSVVTGVTIVPKPEAFKVWWDRFADDPSVRRYFVLLHTASFGTKGPGQDTAIAADLNLIASNGTLLVYNDTNIARNTTVSVLDVGDVGRHAFQNGDVVGAITVSPGVTYYAAVIAQLQNGRYSTDFSTVVSSAGGPPSVGNDIADAGPVQNLSMLPWSPKKGWREIHEPPLTNYTSPRGYTVSYYFNNGSSTFWMNPETGALLATVAGAIAGDERNIANTGGVQVFVKVNDTRHTTGIALADTTLDVVFRVNGVKARVRAINRQGINDVISANSAETAVVIPSVDSTTAVPGALAFPLALTVNTVDGDPEKSMARIVVNLSTANGLGIDVNNIREFGVYAVEITESGAQLGEYQLFSRMITGATASTLPLEFYLRMGENYQISFATAINGDKETTTSGTPLTFRAGGVITIKPSDTGIVPAPIFGTITREDGSNKIDLVPINIAQTGGVAIFYKKLLFEVNINGQGWNAEPGIGLRFEDELNVIAGTYSKTLRIKRKGGVTAQYRATAYAVGGKSSTTTTSALQAVTTNDLLFDTAAPNNGTALVINRAKFKRGSLLIDFVMPSAQMNTHWKTVLIIRDSGSLNYDPFTASWVSTYPDGTTELTIGKGGVQGLGIFKSEVFVSGRTSITVKIGVWNQFNGGTATYSNVVAITQTNSENESPSDQVVPGQPPAPRVKESYGDIVVVAKPPATGASVLTKWQVAVTNANAAPTTADPPTAPDSTFFFFEEGADGIQRFRFTSLIETVYFWTRCKNANNPSTGGTGNNGWSNWSPSTSQVFGTVTRPLQDEIGTGPPNVLGGGTGNALGYLNVGATVSSGIFLPLNAYDDGVNIYYEFLLPTDQNAFSLIAVQWQFYKTSSGALKQAGSFSPSITSTLVLSLSNFVSTFRFRIKNKYRTGGNSGWSAWTNYARRAGNPGLLDYNPGVTIQIESDFYGEGAYPTRYGTP